ncbi:MAG TPA: hypothetical protein VHR45_02280 [Thermoanaerobaculia bacterium]|nr:hypothetical protein [Thermoanaerobaculia bacterium]
MTAHGSSWIVSLARERSVQVAVALWAACGLAIYPLSHGRLPFNWPMLAGAPFSVQVGTA